MNRALMTRLADLRRRRGLAQRDVVADMGLSRHSRQYIRLIESGEIDPRLSTVLRYAEAVGARLTIPGSGPVTHPHQLILTIAAIRLRRRLTQQAVDDLMGVSPQYVSRIEAGQRCPRLSMLARYADAVGVGIVIQTQGGGAR